MKCLTLAVALCAVSCNAQQAKDVTRTILTIADIACVIANAQSQTPAVLEACKIEQTFAPDVEKVIAAHKTAAKKAACAPSIAADAGK